MQSAISEFQTMVCAGLASIVFGKDSCCKCLAPRTSFPSESQLLNDFVTGIQAFAGLDSYSQLVLWSSVVA